MAGMRRTHAHSDGAGGTQIRKGMHVMQIELRRALTGLRATSLGGPIDLMPTLLGGGGNRYAHLPGCTIPIR